MKAKMFVLGILLSYNFAQASNITDFQELSNNGALEDSACINANGTPLPVHDNEMKTIIHNAKNVDKRLYYQDSVYVIYGTLVSGAMPPKYDLTLCKFKQ